MAESAPAYRRLKGTGYHYILPVWALILLFFAIGIFVLLFRGRRTQLWLGPDHLLMVELDGYREHYKRFAYQDIQAVLIRKTPEGTIVNSILIGVVLLLLGPSLLVQDPVGRGLLWGLAGFFALLLLINLLNGPTCKCQLRTAVQTVELPPWTRLKTARKALAQIRPRIDEVQSRVTPPGPASSSADASGTTTTF